MYAYMHMWIYMFILIYHYALFLFVTYNINCIFVKFNKILLLNVVNMLFILYHIFCLILEHLVYKFCTYLHKKGENNIVISWE